MSQNADEDPIAPDPVPSEGSPAAPPWEIEGVVLRLDPAKEREQIAAHHAAQQRQHPAKDKEHDGQEFWAVLAIIAMVIIVVVAFMVLVVGLGNPSAPPRCMPPSCL